MTLTNQISLSWIPCQCKERRDNTTWIILFLSCTLLSDMAWVSVTTQEFESTLYQSLDLESILTLTVQIYLSCPYCQCKERRDIIKWIILFLSLCYYRIWLRTELGIRIIISISSKSQPWPKNHTGHDNSNFPSHPPTMSIQWNLW